MEGQKRKHVNAIRGFRNSDMEAGTEGKYNKGGFFFFHKFIKTSFSTSAAKEPPPPHGSIHHRPGRLNRSLSPRSDPELPHSFTALHSSIFPFSYALPRICICAPRTSHTTEKPAKNLIYLQRTQADEIQAQNRKANLTPAKGKRRGGRKRIYF